MKKIALLIATAFPCILSAQLKMKPGFIVKNNRDTVRGYLKPVAEKQLKERIFFSEKISSEPVAFTTNDITGFGYNGENTFTSITYTHPYDSTTDKRFAKKLVEGYYRLYTFWQGEKNFFILTTYKDSTYLLFDDNYSKMSGIIDEKGNYQNQLLYFSISCESLKESLNYLLYSQSAMSKYVDQLNRCVSPSEENNIVYKKDKSILNIYGYTGAIVLSQGYEFTARIIAKFTIPALDKNISMNVGVNYMAQKRKSVVGVYYPGRFAEQTAYRNIFSVPFTLQYDFTHGRVKPYLDIGTSLDYLEKNGELDYANQKTHNTEIGVGFILAAGVEGYITKRLMIKADWRYELFLHYPTLGIGYFFK